MFAKHMSSKCCCMSIAYHKPNADPPEIPLWGNVEIPCTPSMSAPSYVEPSKGTQPGTVTEQDNDMVEEVDNYLMNPELENGYVGVDEEEKDEDYDPSSDSESDSMSDTDMVAEVDDIVKDRLPSHIPEVAYNKDDPPMEVGSIYPNISKFKLALATHAIKMEAHLMGLQRLQQGEVLVTGLL
ncbi:hypothetical protein GQ55_2G168400 [Panicum hallii var. hallii]|uniref:Uncharacterized protein n=1 Tax=Panicum hallii var. hallii TaxID=1504633 RepID=A0A2T7EQ28_9POAL|nr:hypothetical protein GQ55_2G168400 [Panicum hallii var. hallii]